MDMSDPEEPEYYEDPAGAEGEDVGGGEDPDAMTADGNIITSGDTGAAAAAERKRKRDPKNTIEEMKKRKIPKEKRTTTPYMTKYERARVLGTRALQIR
jgi:DNA-directed RNA polymerase I, II, and III subunit RPABC2